MLIARAEMKTSFQMNEKFKNAQSKGGIQTGYDFQKYVLLPEVHVPDVLFISHAREGRIPCHCSQYVHARFVNISILEWTKIVKCKKYIYLKQTQPK